MGDLLALQLFHPPLLLADVADEGRCLAPVGGGKVKGPLEHAAVRGGGAAIAHGKDGDLVDGGLGDQLIGNPGGERVDVGSHPLVLQLLVALDADLGIVLGLAFLRHDPHAVDPAIARIEQRVIIAESVRRRNAVGRIGARAVDQHGKELLVLRQQRARRHADPRHCDAEQGQRQISDLHGSPLCWVWVDPSGIGGESSTPSLHRPIGFLCQPLCLAWHLNREKATAAVFACRSATAGQSHWARR